MRFILVGLTLFTAAQGFASPIDQESDFQALPALAQVREAITLPMDRIFNQGHSLFCWAYSSYHTLRTYYLHAQNDTHDFNSWKDAVSKLNDPKEFRQYLDENFYNSQNEPLAFIRGMLQTHGGLSDDWTQYFPSDRTEFTIPFDRSQSTAETRMGIEQRILTSLKNGAPVAFCGQGHCTSIYGVTLENGRARSYTIADSVANGEDGRSYERPAQRVLGILEVAMSLK